MAAARRDYKAGSDRRGHGPLQRLVSPCGVAGNAVRFLRNTLLVIGAALGAASCGLASRRDGSSLVIHAAPDDFKTDPTGNSGARVACGVIVKK